MASLALKSRLRGTLLRKIYNVRFLSFPSQNNLVLTSKLAFAQRSVYRRNSIMITRNASIFNIPRSLLRSLRFPAFGVAASASILAYIDNRLKQASNYSQGLVLKVKDKIASLRESLGLLQVELPDWLQKVLRLHESETKSNENSDSNSGTVLVAATAAAATAAEQLSLTEEEQVEEADSDMEKEGLMMILTRKMIEIKNILSQIDKNESFVSLPGIVVVGSQSSGKSSVLEGIVGNEFLPKGNSMITRRPIELTLVNDVSAKQSYAEFPDLGLGKITDYSKIRQILSDLNKSVSEEECISIDPIKLVIFSSKVPDLTLVDLPGYIQVSSQTQPEKLREKIIQLCDKYIVAPNIILAVCAADVDLANSPALRASRRLDPEGVRTIGVITKMDLVEPERGVQILKNNEYPLKNGYIGVVCKSPEKNAGKVAESTKLDLVSQYEKLFFDSIQVYRDDAEIQTRISTLKKKLLHVLEASMSSNLTRTVKSVHQELDEASYRFKARFNDRSLTPETYLAETVDSLKQGLREINEIFTKSLLRKILRNEFEQESLNIIAKQYWTKLQSRNNEAQVFSDKQLEKFTTEYTTIGIGRLSTALISQRLKAAVDELAAKSTSAKHSLIRNKIAEISQDIIKKYFKSTADQIENCIKPYKYEIEVDRGEWDAAKSRSIDLLSREAKICVEAYRKIEKDFGSRGISKIIELIQNEPRENLKEIAEKMGFTDAFMDRTIKLIFLQERCNTLDQRLRELKSKKCKKLENKSFCPEVFASCISDKFTKTASLFLNIELISQFFYDFPRRLDQEILYSLSKDEIYKFACEDPEIREHIELQRKIELLELASAKLDSIVQYEKAG